MDISDFSNKQLPSRKFLSYQKLRKMKSLIALCLLSVLFAYSVDFEDLPIFMDDEAVAEEISRPEFADFINQFGKYYGYNNTIDTIRDEDMTRLHGAVYLDYTGAGVYRESQVRECNNLLLTGLYGNAHSRSPSSMNTEHLVRSRRRRHF